MPNLNDLNFNININSSAGFAQFIKGISGKVGEGLTVAILKSLNPVIPKEVASYLGTKLGEAIGYNIYKQLIKLQKDHNHLLLIKPSSIAACEHDENFTNKLAELFSKGIKEEINKNSKSQQNPLPITLPPKDNKPQHN